MEGRATRSLIPRQLKLTIMITREVREHLETLAKRYGWSLSKTGYKVIVEGLGAIEDGLTSSDFLEGG